MWLHVDLDRTEVVASSRILSILKMEAMLSSKTLVLEDPHGATSEETAIFRVTVVKT
jgi:hypothetical protein